MTQHPYDQLSKQLLEEFLEPLGTVQRSLEIPGEAKWVDLWFVPCAEVQASRCPPDLLGQIAQRPCLLEPYRNPPSSGEVRSCVLKLLWVQEELRRKAQQQKQSLTSGDFPLLWILATSVSKPVLREFGAEPCEGWVDGIYFSDPGFGTVFVSINELPSTRETLLLRILGRGQTHRQAISEVLSLSVVDAQRLPLLRILGNWKVTLELSEIEPEERESMMVLSQAFLEWEQATERRGIEQGEKTLVLRLLTRKIGRVSPDAIAQIQSLSLEQIEALGTALLDFKQPEDLQAWLEQY